MTRREQSQPVLGISFALTYEKGKPSGVRAIWGRERLQWVCSDLDQGRDKRSVPATQQLTAIYAYLELVRSAPDVADALDDKLVAGLTTRAWKLLKCQNLGLLSRECFFCDLAEARRIRGPDQRGVYHPFLRRWFEARDTHIEPQRAFENAEIYFLDADAGLSNIQAFLDGTSAGRHRRPRSITSPAQLREIVETLGMKEKQTPPSHRGSRSESLRAAEKYLTGLRAQSDLKPPAVYQQPTLQRYHRPPVIRSGARPMNRFLTDTGSSPTMRDESTALSDLLSTTGCRAILGPSGAGKTSALLYILRELLRCDGQPEAVPVYVDLTRASKLPAELIAAELGLPADKSFPDDLPPSARFDLLFDGLDRADNTLQKGKFALASLRLAEDERVKSVFLTCKTTDWPDTYLRDADVVAWRICPFTTGPDGDVEQFISSRLPELGQDLIDHLNTDSRLAELVTNPQLLELICDIVEREGGVKKLPKQKSVMIREWLRSRLQLQDHPDSFWYYSAVPALAEIAQRMIDRDLLEISRPELAVDGVEIGSSSDGRDLLDLSKEAGILLSSATPTGSDHIQFTHQTYQEYFAALQLGKELRNAPAAAMAMAARLYRWDESVLMSLEMTDASDYARAIKTLLPLSPLLTARSFNRARRSQREKVQHVILDLLAKELAEDVNMPVEPVCAVALIDADGALELLREVMARDPAKVILCLDPLLTDPLVVSKLRMLADDSDEEIAKAAAQAILQNAPGSVPELVMKHVKGACRPELQYFALLALPTLRQCNLDRSSVLATVLRDPKANEHCRRAAASGLATLNLKLLAEVLADIVIGERPTQRVLMEILAGCQDDLSGAVKLDAMQSGVFETSGHLLSSYEAEANAERLLAIFTDPSQPTDLRELAGRQLTDVLGRDTAPADKFLDLVRDSNTNIARSAIKCLAKYPLQGVRAVLVEFYQEAPDKEIASTLASTIARIDPPTAVRVLLSDATRGVYFAARAVASSVRERPGLVTKEIVNDLQAALKRRDRDPLWEGCMLEMLLAIAPEDKRLRSRARRYADRVYVECGPLFLNSILPVLTSEEQASWLISVLRDEEAQPVRDDLLRSLVNVLTRNDLPSLEKLAANRAGDVVPLGWYLKKHGMLSTIVALSRWIDDSQIDQFFRDVSRDITAAIYTRLDEDDQDAALRMMYEKLGSEAPHMLALWGVDPRKRIFADTAMAAPTAGGGRSEEPTAGTFSRAAGSRRRSGRGRSGSGARERKTPAAGR